MTNHEAAWADVYSTFHSSCSRPLTDRAEDKLSMFFELTVGALITHELMGWTEPAEQSKREFVLRCTRDAANFAEREAGGGQVTEEIMIRAAEHLVKLEKVCPLPENPYQKGSACAELEDIVTRKLRENPPVPA